MTTPLDQRLRGTLAFEQAQAVLREGYDYWASRIDAGELMPRRAAIDPVDIRHLLPNVVYLEVSDAPRDFIERVTGETVLYHCNANSMGIWWRQYPGRGPDSAIWAHYAAVADEAAPRIEALPYVGPHRDFLTVQTASCPVSENGDGVNRILSFVDFVKR